MNIIRYFSDQITKLKIYSRWDITDLIVRIDDIVPNQHPDFLDRYNLEGEFVCIKNFKYNCIYLKSENLDKFINNCDFCDKNKNLICLTRLLHHQVQEDCYSQVISKAAPPYISIKQIIICKIDDYEIYIERMIRLNKSEELFKDLMNLQLMKDYHNLK